MLLQTLLSLFTNRVYLESIIMFSSRWSPLFSVDSRVIERVITFHIFYFLLSKCPILSILVLLILVTWDFSLENSGLRPISCMIDTLTIDQWIWEVRKEERDHLLSWIVTLRIVITNDVLNLSTVSNIYDTFKNVNNIILTLFYITSYPSYTVYHSFLFVDN